MADALEADDRVFMLGEEIAVARRSVQGHRGPWSGPESSALNQEGDLSRGATPLGLGRTTVVRDGSDVTAVATQLAGTRSEEAAAVLAREGISVELIAPPTLVSSDDFLIPHAGPLEAASLPTADRIAEAARRLA